MSSASSRWLSKRQSSARDISPDSNSKRRKGQSVGKIYGRSHNSSASRSQERYHSSSSPPRPARKVRLEHGKGKLGSPSTSLTLLARMRGRHSVAKRSSTTRARKLSPSTSRSRPRTRLSPSPSSSSDLDSSNTSRSSPVSDTLHQQRVIALDCEMVEVREGMRRKSALGRCSIIDYDGETIFDEYVRPEQQITDYRTYWSGIERSDLVDATPFRNAIKKIHKILHNKIIVGHHLQYDFEVLNHSHPIRDVRDTSDYVPVRALAGLPRTQKPSLKKLSANILHRTIQDGSHCSVVDATASLDIYKRLESEWEASTKP